MAVKRRNQYPIFGAKTGPSISPQIRYGEMIHPPPKPHVQLRIIADVELLSIALQVV